MAEKAWPQELEAAGCRQEVGWVRSLKTQLQGPTSSDEVPTPNGSTTFHQVVVKCSNAWESKELPNFCFCCESHATLPRCL